MDEVVADLERYEASLQAGAVRPATPPRARRHDFADRSSPPPPEPEGRSESERTEELQPFEVKAVAAKSVLCVEAQDEIQDALRKSLTGWGYRALLVADAERPPSGSASPRSTP